MDYETFKRTVMAKVLMCLPEGVFVEDVKMIKDNNIVLSGISIIYPSKYMSPVLYLEPFFKEACQGVGMGQIVSDILVILKAVSSLGKENGEGVNLEWGNIRDKIYPRLVNAQKNREILSKVPHQRFLDLAVVYYIEFPLQSSVQGRIEIRASLFEMWGIPLQELHGAALQNLEKMKPNVLCLGDPQEPEQYIMGVPKYPYGAEVILCPDVLGRLADKVDADLYIIPLAVDAVEAVPINGIINVEEVYAAIKEAGSMKMESADYLSGELYLYERNTGKIRLTIVPQIF